jgi:hypothetical protein
MELTRHRWKEETKTLLPVFWATPCALLARGGLKKKLFRLWKMRPWEALHDVNSIDMGDLVRGGRSGTLGMSYKMHGKL